MRFRIGSDLGMVLAKGVAISLIFNFIFMPSMILLTYKIIDKTHHRKLVTNFDRFSKFIVKIMIPLSCVFAIIIVPSYLASNSNSFYYGSSHIFNEETKIGSDTALIEDTFEKSDTYVILVAKDTNSVQKELSNKLNELPQVNSILYY